MLTVVRGEFGWRQNNAPGISSHDLALPEVRPPAYSVSLDEQSSSDLLQWRQGGDSALSCRDRPISAAVVRVLSMALVCALSACSFGPPPSELPALELTCADGRQGGSYESTTEVLGVTFATPDAPPALWPALIKTGVS